MGPHNGRPGAAHGDRSPSHFWKSLYCLSLSGLQGQNTTSSWFFTTRTGQGQYSSQADTSIQQGLRYTGAQAPPSARRQKTHHRGLYTSSYCDSALGSGLHLSYTRVWTRTVRNESVGDLNTSLLACFLIQSPQDPSQTSEWVLIKSTFYTLKFLF